jgi:polyhydroxyalkanoate synthesis repressor PhaR
MAILIKRYANRKLYNTDTSRYITLKGIAELIDCGEEVRVIDNETGEDITKVALSQILVDSERSHSEAPNGLLSQIFERGGDALYGALRKSMDDASENLEELQGRVRRLVSREGIADADDEAGSGFSNWIAFGAPDMDHVVQNAVERVFKILDLPRRSDIDALNQNLERVATAVEALERRVTPRTPDSSDS